MALTKEDRRKIARLVRHYSSNQPLQDAIKSVASGLTIDLQEWTPLRGLLHFVRGRTKDPTHLADKLERKEKERPGWLGKVTKENLGAKVTDLVGVRIVHLHTSQFPRVHSALVSYLSNRKYQITEGPKARIWDSEYREYFQEQGVPSAVNKRMYTSVHYVVRAPIQLQLKVEIQVRTLSEELWGETDHALNYPVVSRSVACKEQIRVLARVASSATRLVDSIFRSDEEFKMLSRRRRR